MSVRVKILRPFRVDSAEGEVKYTVGQIVPNGLINWIDKGLAVEEAAKPAPKSAD